MGGLDAAAWVVADGPPAEAVVFALPNGLKIREESLWGFPLGWSPSCPALADMGRVFEEVGCVVDPNNEVDDGAKDFSGFEELSAALEAWSCIISFPVAGVLESGGPDVGC